MSGGTDRIGPFWWDARFYSRAMRAAQDMRAHNQDPVVDQIHYRWQQPGTESSGNWLAAIDTALTVAQDGLGNYDLFFRVELEDSTTNADQNLTRTYKLQVQRNALGYNDVTASSSIAQVVAHADITDGGATTNQITGSTDTFRAGEIDEGDGTWDSTTWVTGRSHIELLASVRLIDADLSAGDTITFRVIETGGGLLQTYSVTPTVNWTAPAASFNFDGFRFYDDDDTESASTALAAEDTDITLPPSKRFQFRAAVAATVGSGTFTPLFQFRLNAGGWTTITAATAIYFTDSPNFTHDSTTADRATNGITNSGGGSFVAGRALDTAASGTGASLTNGDWTESLIALAIDYSQVADGDVIDLRITDNGTALDDWTDSAAQLASITVVKPRPYMPVKPGPSLAPVRRDGHWHGLYWAFPFLDADGMEVVQRLYPTIYPADIDLVYGDYGPEWDSAGGGADRLLYDLSDGHRETLARGEPELGFTMAVLVRVDPGTSMPASTAISHRYNGTTAAYPWRLLHDTGLNLEFQMQLNGAARVTSQLAIPDSGEYYWIVCRWEPGKTVRFQIMDLIGAPVTLEAATSAAFNGPIQYQTGDAPPDDDYIALWGDSNSSWEDVGAAVYVWDRELDDFELDRFFADPWDLFEPAPKAAADNNVTITVPAGSLTLTGQAPTVALGPLTVTVPVGSMALTGQAPTAALGPLSVTPGAASLSLVGQAPTVALGPAVITVPAGSLVLAGQAPTVALGPLTVTPGAGALVLTGQTPVVSLGADVTVTVPAGSLALTGQAPSVALGPATVTPGAGALVLTGQAPTVTTTANVTVTVPTGALTLSGQAPTAALGPIAVVVPAASLALSGQAPTVTTTANVTVTVPAGSLTLSGQAPSVALGPLTVTVPVGSLVLTGQQPTVQTGGNVTVTVPAGSLTLSGQAPAVALGPATVTPGAGSLALTGRVPTVTTTANIRVTVPAGSLTLSGQAPAVALGPLTVTPGAGSLVLTGQAPTIQTGGNLTVTVPAGSLALTGRTPTVALGPLTVTVPAGALAITGQVPIIDTSADVAVVVPVGSMALTGAVPTVALGPLTVTVPAGSLALTGQQPTVQLGDNVTVTVPVGSLALTGQAPTAALGPIVVTAGTQGLVITTFPPTVSVTQNIRVTVPTGTLSTTGQAPTVALGPLTVTVPVGSLALSGLAPTVVFGDNVPVKSGNVLIPSRVEGTVILQSQVNLSVEL